MIKENGFQSLEIDVKYLVWMKLLRFKDKTLHGMKMCYLSDTLLWLYLIPRSVLLNFYILPILDDAKLMKSIQKDLRIKTQQHTFLTTSLLSWLQCCFTNDLPTSILRQ